MSEAARTLRSEEVPGAFKEHFIHSGYRVLGRPWTFYFQSSFRLHNETGNFWTHALALLLLARSMLLDYAPLLNLRDPISWPFLLGYTACCGMFLASAAAHLLHSKSRLVHQLCFMADYAGIGLFGLGTALPHLFYVSDHAFFTRWEGLHLEIMAALALFSCLLGCYFKVVERARARRITQSFAILAMYLWSMAPAVFRYSTCLRSDSPCELDSVFLTHVYQLVSLSLAAIFYGSHLPEALLPGRFDILGHSHQIFHVFIYLNMHFGAQAAFGHLIRMPEDERVTRRPASLIHLLSPILFVVLSETLVIALLARFYHDPLLTPTKNKTK